MMATRARTGETIASAIRTAPMPTAQSSRGCGASPLVIRVRAVRSARRDDASGHRFQDAVGCLPAYLGLRAEDQAVAERGSQERFHMVGRDELMPFEGGVSASAQHQQNFRPR